LEPSRPEPLAPSRPEGASLGPVTHALSPLAAREQSALRLKRGQLLHALLQHLPELPPDERHAAAIRFLARPGNGLASADVTVLAGETTAILEHSEMAALFGPGSRAEVPLTGVVDGTVIGGLVDRLAVTADAVLVADYKTHRDPPAEVADTPVLYLRQMAAYRAVLRAIFPGRRVECALVWTQAARVATLPPGLLDRHAPGTSQPVT
jgi:ATP-dependent helicase/nuclease subunit A